MITTDNGSNMKEAIKQRFHVSIYIMKIFFKTFTYYVEIVYNMSQFYETPIELNVWH